MDDRRFDTLTKSLSISSVRRGLMRGIAATTLGFAVTRFPLAAEAKKKNRKRKSKPPVAPPFNAFGCLNVGASCNGDSALCCSGICEGLKPKKGKPDTSVCVAHNAAECQASDDTCLEAEQITCGADGFGVCTRTTGKASFCGAGGACVACQRDTDCEALGFGDGAACVLCRRNCPDTITICLTARD